MELFSVKRYTEGEQFTDDPSKEDEILQKLLKKVQSRKSTQSVETSNNVSDIPVVKENQLELEGEEEEEKDEATDSPKKAKLSDEPTESTSEDFQVLGSNVFDRKPKVEMVLPPWLAHPTVIATSIVESTEQEDSSVHKSPYLSEHVKESLKELSIDNLFPVQKSVIPWMLAAHSKPFPFRPRDICVSAPTGSGKTLAFAVPIVQLLENRVEKKIRALVVLPVAELALQVYKVFKKLTEKTTLNVVILSKSFPFHLEQQKLVESYKGKFYSKVDIVITTPGRLVEHLHATNGFCLKSLKFLVIDEADRIMNQVHHNWLYHLDNHVKTTSDMLLSGRAAPLCINELESSACTQPHKMLFSATLSQDPEKLQSIRLFQPKLFTSVLTKLDVGEKSTDVKSAEIRDEFIGKYTTPAELTEKYCITESRIKPLTLYSLITENKWTKFLCFTNSVESSHRLAYVLKILFKDTLMSIGELSAGLSGKVRTNVLSSFARGKVNGLICSDALARGIDIPDVDIVISYDPARHIKTYIHRIGRTARAGRPGTAITLLTQKELDSFNHTLSEVGKAITEEIKVSTNVEESNAKVYASALESLRKKVESDKHSKIIIKNIAKEKAKLVNTNKTDMTLMEKLQVQVTKRVLQGAEAKDGHILVKERKKKNPMKTFKEKKLNKVAKGSHTIGKAKQNKKK